nr:hypothetical protein [Paenibacillus bovis]
MKNVEIYMTESVADNGTRKTAGYIYDVEEHIAEQLVSKGVAKVVNYPTLRRHETTVTNIVDQLKQELKAIEDNMRLTDTAKEDDKKALLEKYKQHVEEINAEYSQELDNLLEKAMEKASELKSELDYDKDVVRVKVGHIKTDVTMASSFTEALELLQKEVKMADKNVASELLADFTEIKRELDSLGQNISPPTRNRYIREIYDNLKVKSRDEKQSEAALEVDMLSSIKRNSNIKRQFEIATMFI